MSGPSDFYLARAADCAREADATDLENVRDRCLRSQAVWLSMANRLQKKTDIRAKDAADEGDGLHDLTIQAQTSL